MTKKEANQIGGRQGLFLATLGLICALIIFILGFYPFGTFVDDLLSRYLINVLLGVFWLYLFGYIFGRLAGRLILIKKRNYFLVGILTGLAVLVATAFFTSWTALYQEGLSYIQGVSNPLYDYLIKPMLWLVSGGFFPAILAGIWMGWRIKKIGEKRGK